MAVKKRSPHILVFFCDQLRIDLLGCYGGELVRTPNLDALASESVVFDHAYTPCALCSPARASLMTGLYPHGHHMFNNSTPGYSFCEHLRSDIHMLPDWVSGETDYETAYFGKWHIGPAADLFASRFDHTHPRPDQGDLPFLGNSHWHPNTKLGPLVKSMAGGRAGTIDLPMERFPDVVAASYTRQFLRSRSAGSHPFCAFCSFPGPHSPWLVPDAFGIRYEPSEIPIWENRADTFEGKPLNQVKLNLLGQREAKRYRDVELQEALACCFSYLELIDEQVGVVIEELKNTGLYDNTMIIFTADHGDMAGSHGFQSKGSYMYDEIYRIPLMIKTPESDPGRRVDVPVHLMDVTATLMHVMRGEPVKNMNTHALHGSSLLPLIEGKNAWPRSVHYAEYHGDWYGHYSARMVTDGTWKLVWNFSDLGELYDLENDPNELTNLFYDPEYGSTRDQYFKLLREEAVRLEDKQVAMLDPAIEDDYLLNLQTRFDKDN